MTRLLQLKHFRASAICIVGFLAFAMASQVSAEEFLLVDGSTLSGKVTNTSEGGVEIQTDFGPMQLAWEMLDAAVATRYRERAVDVNDEMSLQGFYLWALRNGQVGVAREAATQLGYTSAGQLRQVNSLEKLANEGLVATGLHTQEVGVDPRDTEAGGVSEMGGPVVEAPNKGEENRRDPTPSGKESERDSGDPKPRRSGKRRPDDQIQTVVTFKIAAPVEEFKDGQGSTTEEITEKNFPDDLNNILVAAGVPMVRAKKGSWQLEFNDVTMEQVQALTWMGDVMRYEYKGWCQIKLTNPEGKVVLDERVESKSYMNTRKLKGPFLKRQDCLSKVRQDLINQLAQLVENNLLYE